MMIFHIGIALNSMKRISIIALGIFIFFLILLGVTFLESLKKDGPPTTNFPTPTSAKISYDSPRQNFKYNKNGLKNLLDTVMARPTPSRSDDKTAKAKITKLANASTGYINSTVDYEIVYFKSANIIGARIKNNNYKFAENEVVDFLKQNGLSEEGICKLPLMFYFTNDVSRSIVEKKIEISPIPDFCL